jgi:hypothetical protein
LRATLITGLMNSKKMKVVNNEVFWDAKQRDYGSSNIYQRVV